MHDGMPYEPIQCQGHGGLKVAKITDLKVDLRWCACNQKD